MDRRTFQLRCPGLFDLDQLQNMEASAVRILSDVGIGIPDEGLRSQFEKRGYQIADGRILLEPATVHAFLYGERGANGQSFTVDPEAVEPTTHAITLSTLPYPQFVHEPETDQIVPFDTERLIEATKLIDVLSDRGISGTSPGCPTDAPPALQPVLQYWISATYCRSGRRPVDPKSDPASVSFVQEMGAILDRPLTSMPIYVLTPLALSGESLKVALAAKGLTGLHISDMASMGCTTPIMPADAFAMCVAEVVGAAILIAEIVDVPITWSIRLCPADLRYLSLTLGTPEDFHLELANHQVNGYFHGKAWHPSLQMHTMAKLPGAQACTEKTSLVTAGGLLGVRHFGSAGSLSLDEVFSPEQLIYDVEMRDHVERMCSRVNVASDPATSARQVKQGIEEQTFAGLETTRDAFREVYWHPELYDRSFLNGWLNADSRSMREKTLAKIPELVKKHEFELDAVTQLELDKVLERAKREFEE